LEKSIYYLDLNSTSPRTARYIASILATNPGIRFLDGGIIGGLPHLKVASESESSQAMQTPSWHCPNLILSGPNKIPDPTLSQILNVHHLGDQIGAATGLKMCFGMNTKGFGAIVIQSFTTAYRLGLLSELREYMRKYNPMALQLAEKGIVVMPPKAYKWVYEMSEMAETVAEDGGFGREL
jgi:3-hydroxyisobutyrate dehydrogenase-like beta-hydroxyacid dehydrogenase